MRLISIIVPVYNEEGNINKLYHELTQVINKLRNNYSFEIIFVNDGSQDQCTNLINELAKGDSRIKLIEFSRNFGKEIAISAGLHHAKGEAAIMIDADLQHPPEKIEDFLREWENNYEIVVGVRDKSKSDGWFKRAGSYLFYKIMNTIGDSEITPNATDFRLIDRIVIDEFNKFTERNRMTRGLLDWLGFRKTFINFEANKRIAGRPAYNKMKLIKLAMSSFVSYSLLPLKIAGYLGIFITLFSAILGIYILFTQYIFDFLIGLHFSGTAQLAILILFLIGIVLSSLGLIALYIGNIHSEVTNRPMYIIRRKTNLDES